MSGSTKLVLAVVVLVLAIGVLFLAAWDIPPPSSTIEKTLPDDRFPR
ncbi:MAG: hypothetical protein HY521_15335 [Proteobacteria bacterium]|nr:hypothetical protein [Pseudomonadota bacterium]